MKKKCAKQSSGRKVLIAGIHTGLCGDAKDMKNVENLVLLNCGITKKVLRRMAYEELGILSSILLDAMLEVTTLRAEKTG
jgi:hypothetical protein